MHLNLHQTNLLLLLITIQLNTREGAEGWAEWVGEGDRRPGSERARQLGRVEGMRMKG